MAHLVCVHYPLANRGREKKKNVNYSLAMNYIIRDTITAQKGGTGTNRDSNDDINNKVKGTMTQFLARLVKDYESSIKDTEMSEYSFSLQVQRSSRNLVVTHYTEVSTLRTPRF